jgi:hypothetical protein
MPKTMKDVVREAARMGRRGADGVKDDRLAHINAQEARMLEDAGGAGTINPKTGLQEFKYGADTNEGGATGGPKGNSGNGGAGGGNGPKGPAQGPNKDGSTVDVNPKGEGNFNNGAKANTGPKGQQVYSSPIGPMPDGTPMGNSVHHAAEPTDSILDSILGYDTYGDRMEAYANNPEASHNQTYVAQVPAYPYADMGYLVASLLDTPMSPWGALAYAPTAGYAIATNQAPEGAFQQMASAMGADRGPQVGENGVGYDRGGGGGAIFNGAQVNNADVVEDEPYTGPYDKQTTYTSDGKPPVVKKVPTSLTQTILNAMAPQAAQVVG